MSSRYATEFGRALLEESARWKAVTEGVVVGGGYVWTAWLWWASAPAWQIHLVGGLSTVVAFLVVLAAGRRAWRREHALRTAAERALAERTSSDQRVAQWRELTEKFRSLANYDISAELHAYDGHEEWIVLGPTAHVAAFKSACEWAGNLLRRSAGWDDKHAGVKRVPDDCEQWLTFLAQCSGWQPRGSTASANTLDGPVVAEGFDIHPFNDLPLMSKRQCEEMVIREQLAG